MAKVIKDTQDTESEGMVNARKLLDDAERELSNLDRVEHMHYVRLAKNRIAALIQEIKSLI